MEAPRAFRLSPIISILVFGLAPGLARATSDCQDIYFLSVKVMTKCEETHYLPVGAGVSSPSVGASYIENPAGLAYNRQLKVHGALVKGTESSPWRYGIVGLGGTGDIGGGLGFNRYRQDVPELPPVSVVTYGIGGSLQSIAAGLALSTPFSNGSGIFSQPTDGTYLSSNAGTILNPRGNLKAGFTAYDVFGGVKGYGVGVSGSPGRNFSTALDMVLSPSLRPSTTKIGFATSAGSFLLTAGYGFRSNEVVTGVRIPGGFSFGLGYVASKNFRMTFAYNQIEAIYWGLTIGL